ncbi:peptidyl-prolyl cis-trans isomerase [Candidatus Omnitrophota bacterium]
MHYFNKMLKTLFISTVLILSMSQMAFAIEDAIIARVNEELITFKDLKDYINAIYVRLSAEGIEESEIQRIIKDLEKTGISKLIEDKLILSEANNIGIEINTKLIESRVESLKGRYPSHDAFMDSLILNGSNLSELRKTITDQLKIQYIIEHAVKSKVIINPQEITAYYDENPQLFQKKETIDIDSIFIAIDNNPELAKEKAKAALDLLEQGEDFTEISTKYSNAPSIGKIERGSFRPEMEEIIFNLIEGELSSLIEVDSGFYIFKVNKKTLAETAPLSIVKNNINDFLYQQKLRDQFNSWIAELKEDAFIEIKK